MTMTARPQDRKTARTQERKNARSYGHNVLLQTILTYLGVFDDSLGHTNIKEG